MEQRQEGALIADRFRLIERVGRGGFGETWKAHDEMLNIDVALKLFYDNDPEHSERYLREARSLARFSSLPGIAGVRDLLSLDGRACLVMEYIDGEDLSKLLRRVGSLSLEQTMRILLPVAEVLSCLHRSGMVHRDVSPDNVCVSSDGMGVLLDFGSALSMSQVATGTITVKPGYAPPEQYGDPSTQGPWTDVYSLAATAYQCLCGKAPSDSLRRTFADDLAAPSQLGVSLPSGVEDAIMRALALDYTQRTQSVGEFVQGLRGQGAREAKNAGLEPPQSAPTITAEVTSAAAPAAPAAAETPAERDSVSEAPLTRAYVDERGADGQQATERSTERKRRPKKDRAATTASKRGSSGSKRLMPLLAGLAAVLVIGAIILLLRMGGTSAGSKSASTSSYVTNEYVTPDSVNGYISAETKYLSFSKCVVSDEAIEALAKNEQIESVTFNYCSGFTTLAPLADAANLKMITLFGFDEMDLGALFSRDFPTLEKLRLQNVRVASGLDALGRFPALTELKLSPVEGVDNVDFLSSLPNLDSLDLSGVDLSGDKLSLLAKLSNLQYVTINYCNVANLDWATGCPGLRDLYASGNQIADLAPLSSAENLANLYLDSNQVSVLAPLSGLPLRQLVLSNNQIASAKGLGDNGSLTTLSLEGNQLTTADGLQGLGELRRLSLAHNELTDVMAVAESTKLEQLDLSYNSLTDLKVCERLIALNKLYAQHNQLEDISALSSCANLGILLLHDNEITDISAISNGFTELKTLNIAFNQISSLEALKNSSQLRYLVANNNQITSLEGLQNKHELEDLMLDSNQITDISALASSMDELENLDLGHNQISDVSVLSNMKSKSTKYGTTIKASVCLDHNNISSIAGIPSTVSFRLLSLYANPLKDFGSLSYETAEWYDLYLPYYKDADFASLGELSIISVTNFVDVPYDEQVQVLRDMNLTTSSYPLPNFITSEKADEEMQAFRDNVNTKVSGTTGPTTDSVADQESVEVESSEDIASSTAVEDEG